MTENVITPIVIGCDHAAVALKESLIDELKAAGYEVEDFGVSHGESIDYPDIARQVADSVASGRFNRGIILCGTGVGVCMTANKVKGIRAAVCSETFSARMARLHNDANIICLGARVVGAGLALDIVRTFLETEFESGTRHQRRVDKIIALDEC